MSDISLPPCMLCHKEVGYPGPSVCDCHGCNTGNRCELFCQCTAQDYCDYLLVENYNLNDEITKLNIEINRLKVELKER